jgi:hypothetical protein
MAAIGSKEMKLVSKVKHIRALLIADKEAKFNMENQYLLPLQVEERWMI